MSPIDLREYKADLRAKRRRRRESLSLEYKKELDRRIAERVTSLYQYKNAKTVMIYASTAIEVDTFEIIERALADGKRIALPRCIKGTRNMEFYYISGLDDLERGSFNVLEPKETLEIVTDYGNLGLTAVTAYLNSVALAKFKYCQKCCNKLTSGARLCKEMSHLACPPS